MAFSVSETLNHLIAKVREIKDENPVAPVTIISPNISFISSINRCLLETGQPFLNVRIETFYQFVKRHAEPILLNEGVPFLTVERADLLIQQALKDNNLKYFHAARDFPSYSRYFLSTINELRISVPQKALGKALQGLGIKGEELTKIYEQYLSAKKDLADYADMLDTWPGTDETLALFPGVDEDLSLMEKSILGKVGSVLRISGQPPDASPTMGLWNPLSPAQEIKEVFRQLLASGSRFDRAAIIAPADYLSRVIEEADQLGIPVFCPHGEDMLLDRIAVFKAALEVMSSDYTYESLKRFFQLKGHFAPISALIECGVAAGGDLIQATAARKYQETQKDRFLKLETYLETFKQIEALMDRPHEMGGTVMEHFLPDSQQTHILKGILNDLSDLVPDADYETWEWLVSERVERIKAGSSHRQNAVFLTTDVMPGAFDDVFLLGIKEGSFPGKFREDPILLDHERETINQETGGTLRTARDKNRELTESLEKTIACPRKAWYGSFPSMDLISGDEEFPSFYLVDVVRQLQGKNVLDMDSYQDTLRSIRIPWTVKKSDQCLDPFEWTLHHILNRTDGFIDHMMKKYGAPLAHIKAYQAYWDADFNEYTGFIQMVDGEDDSARRRFSPTQLERFMTCPYRWFLERGLRVRPLEEPETLEKPDGRVMGSILHEVLETYMRQTKDPIYDKKGLDRILTEVIGREVAATGDIAPIYLDKLRKDLEGLTDAFMKHAEENLKDGRKPIFFEFAFGTYHKENFQEDPVLLKLGKHEILLSGAIDRIDVKDHTAFILDYKNSAYKNYKDVNFMKGQRLQPALYAEAFMALQGKPLKIEAVNTGYLPLAGNNAKECVVPYDEDRKKILESIIDFILQAIEEGYFFPTGNCQWCDYGNICGKGIALSASRKLEHAVRNEKIKELAKAFNSFEEL